MRRRGFITLLGGAAAWPLAARGERSPPTIGYLGSRSRAADAHLVDAFRSGLAEMGYADGRNATIDFRWAEGRFERLPELAAELVRRSVNVIVATGGTPTAIAAKAATAEIPIVFVIGGDPIKTGIVKSIARPEGNLTGLAIMSIVLESKRFEILCELLPEATPIAMLVNPINPNLPSVLPDVQAAARAARRQLVIVKAADERQLDAAFATIGESRAAALLVAADPFLASRHRQIVGAVARLGIPAIYQFREFVADGGLISYGPSRSEPYRQAGIYTGRILAGAKPRELPVQQATKFELAINLQTAKALGLTVPLALLVRADEVIE